MERFRIVFLLLTSCRAFDDFSYLLTYLLTFLSNIVMSCLILCPNIFFISYVFKIFLVIIYTRHTVLPVHMLFIWMGKFGNEEGGMWKSFNLLTFYNANILRPEFRVISNKMNLGRDVACFLLASMIRECLLFLIKILFMKIMNISKRILIACLKVTFMRNFVWSRSEKNNSDIKDLQTVPKQH